MGTASNGTDYEWGHLQTVVEVRMTRTFFVNKLCKQNVLLLRSICSNPFFYKGNCYLFK